MRLDRFAFVPGLLALGLAAFGRSSVPLLQAFAAATVVLAFLLRGASPAGRLLLADGLALLGLALVVLFHTSQGVPVPFPLSDALAGYLVVFTVLYAWAADLTSPRRPARAEPASSRSLAPSRALAFVVVMLAVPAGLAATTFPSRAASYAWLVGAFTGLGLAALSLLCLPRGRWGTVGTVMALTCLEIALVWHAASIEVAMEQGRALPWDEVRARLGEPGGWRVLQEGLSSGRFVLVTVGLFGGYALLARFVGRLSRSTCTLTALRLVASVAVFGGLLLMQPALADPDLAAGYREATAAPWSRVHARAARHRPLDEQAAERIRARLDPPEWEEGPAEPFDGLVGRYPRRSIVLVLMESQAARLMAGLGEGAYGFTPAQPELTRLAKTGVLFTNYFAPGLPTHTALWTLLTGLPLPRGQNHAVESAPWAVRLGRLPDLVSLGYRIDWLCPASPRFDNWDRLLTEIGARWWIENREVRDLDRTHWTSWGMPDEQLYGIALKRYRSAPDPGLGYFMGLLTVSNHRPYRFPTPPGGHLPFDHVDGTRYADHAVGRLVDALRALPEPERPIVFLTADTAQIEGLREHEPLGIFSPEAIRIPGLLLLPDGAAAGSLFEGVFGHEDLLDLLFRLVAPPPEGSGHKFVDRHRVRYVGFGGSQAASADAFCLTSPLRCFAFEGRWHLRPTPPDSLPRLLDAIRQFEADDAALWGSPAPGS